MMRLNSFAYLNLAMSWTELSMAWTEIGNSRTEIGTVWTKLRTSHTEFCTTRVEIATAWFSFSNAGTELALSSIEITEASIGGTPCRNGLHSRIRAASATTVFITQTHKSGTEPRPKRDLQQSRTLQPAEVPFIAEGKPHLATNHRLRGAPLCAPSRGGSFIVLLLLPTCGYHCGSEMSGRMSSAHARPRSRNEARRRR